MPTPAPGSLPDHPVTLNYTEDPNDPKKSTFTASPRRIHVKPGQTIGFKLGAGPNNGKIRVTFKNSDAGRFSTHVFQDGDPHVQVIGDVVQTTYHCELLVKGEVVAASDENGGEIEPVRGT